MEAVQSLIGNFGGIFGWITAVVAAHPIPAALLTTLSILSAVWTNYRNRAATIFGHSMQAITHLDQRWESAEMRRFRRWAATYLLRQCKAPLGSKVHCTSQEREGLKAVLNFLETVGCFVRMGAIGRRTAWQLFGSAAQLYVESARPDLERYQQPRETVYTEMSYLYAVARIEEVRVTLPGAWLWSRLTAFSLTWNGVAREGRWLGKRPAFCWNVVTSVLTGNVAEFHLLKPLFSLKELDEHLANDSALNIDGDSFDAAREEASLKTLLLRWIQGKLRPEQSR